MITAPWIVAVVLVACTGCAGERATREDCVEILNRIVEIELRERGFRDPVLLERRRQELRSRFASDLAECEGRPLESGSLACVRRARTTEELSHRCLHSP